MMEADKYTSRITDYIYNDMSEKERIAFEKEIDGNQDLAEEVNRQKTILKELDVRIRYNQARNDPHRAEADQLAEEVIKKRSYANVAVRHRQKKKIRYYYFFAASAAVIIMLIISGILYMNPTTDDLFDRYYAPFETISFTMRSMNDTEATLENGYNAYFNRNYDEAVMLLNEARNTGKDSPETSFMLGLSLLGNRQYYEASIVFEDHLKNFKHMNMEVKWYLALSYLKLDETRKAEKLISDIAGSGGNFGQEARELQQRLRKINRE